MMFNRLGYVYRNLPFGNGNLTKFSNSQPWMKLHLQYKISFQQPVGKRCFTNGGNYDSALQKLQRAKKIFAFSLFTGTLVMAWILKQKKGERLKELLEDCQRLQFDTSLFKDNFAIYRYHGYSIAGPIVMSGILKELKKFQFKPDDVIVSSFPKTGTTWVQEIVYMLTHNFQCSDSTTELLETRFPYLEYPYPGIKSIEAKKGRRFIKTHMPYQLLPESFAQSGAKAIYVSRNPRDTAVSYFYFVQFMNQISFLGSFREFVKLFISNIAPYSPFFDHVLSYWNMRKDPNIMFIMYEELHQNPLTSIRKIAEFLEVDVTDDDLLKVALYTSFTSMKNNSSVNYEHWKDIGFARKDGGSFMRKGKVGDWKNHMDEDMVAEFEKWEAEKLTGSDLRFVYELPSNDSGVNDYQDIDRSN
ncbi:sulfotransferase 1E1-like isoform X2 [Oratosquilla oratoria]|uniref:sulfotransferase 1E1-like isoform X2 n=1 Tax=Oratosquilla oratoria TaxID=337810 RepID=UPI003F76C948